MELKDFDLTGSKKYAEFIGKAKYVDLRPGELLTIRMTGPDGEDLVHSFAVMLSKDMKFKCEEHNEDCARYGCQAPLSEGEYRQVKLPDVADDLGKFGVAAFTIDPETGKLVQFDIAEFFGGKPTNKKAH